MSEGEPAPQKRKREIEELVEKRIQQKEYSTERYRAKLMLQEKLGCENHKEVCSKLEEVVGDYLAKDYEFITERILQAMTKDGYHEESLMLLFEEEMFPTATIHYIPDN